MHRCDSEEGWSWRADKDFPAACDATMLRLYKQGFTQLADSAFEWWVWPHWEESVDSSDEEMGTKEWVEKRAREEGLVKLEKVEEPQIEAPMAEAEPKAEEPKVDTTVDKKDRWGSGRLESGGGGGEALGRLLGGSWWRGSWEAPTQTIQVRVD